MTDQQARPITISHSQLGVWQNCQQQWDYNYNQKIIPKETKSHFRRGTLVHELSNVYYQVVQQGLPVGSRAALDHVMSFAESDLANLAQMSSSELEDYTRALASITRFIREFSPTVDEYIEVVALEEYFSIELLTPKGRLVTIEGYIDRIYKQLGNLWVLDTKSSATGRHYNATEILMDNQLTTYAAILRLMGYDVFGVAIDSISTYPYKHYEQEPFSKLFKRIVSHRSEREMQFSLNNYLRAADDMLDYKESSDPPVRRLTRDCIRCAYCDLCLYEMKGIPTEMLLSEKYRSKEPIGRGDSYSALGLRYSDSTDSTSDSGE